MSIDPVTAKIIAQLAIKRTELMGIAYSTRDMQYLFARNLLEL